MIYHGDLYDVLPTLEADSIDACVTDPPYNLTEISWHGRSGGGIGFGNPRTEEEREYRRTATRGFMGKAWDGTGVAFNVETWRQVFRVLKPGAHLLAFGGTRTYHRMTCAIEDAGFEIRDCLMWLYGSGFPKSLDVSKAMDAAIGADSKIIGVKNVPITAPSTDLAKQWQGWGTALKPACEPIVMARKPLIGTVAANVERYGTGAIHVDACRIEHNGRRSPEASDGTIHRRTGSVYGEHKNSGAFDTTVGRWPANVLFDEEAAALLDQQTGELVVNPHGPNSGKGIWGSGQQGHPTQCFTDSGGASRFYYVAKPSRGERTEGVDRNGHPTVKPIEVMRWLVRLVTPPEGVVLDPFMGAGTTGMACRYELRRFIGIEREAEYVAIARARIDQSVPLFANI